MLLLILILCSTGVFYVYPYLSARNRAVATAQEHRPYPRVRVDQGRGAEPAEVEGSREHEAPVGRGTRTDDRRPTSA